MTHIYYTHYDTLDSHSRHFFARESHFINEKKTEFDATASLDATPSNRPLERTAFGGKGKGEGEQLHVTRYAQHVYTTRTYAAFYVSQFIKQHMYYRVSLNQHTVPEIFTPSRRFFSYAVLSVYPGAKDARASTRTLPNDTLTVDVTARDVTS